VIIERLPSFLQRFFSPMRSRLSKPQFAHLWSLVLAACERRAACGTASETLRLPAGGVRTAQFEYLADVDRLACGSRAVPCRVGRPKNLLTF
jgi:hypothetical protein